MKSLTQKVLSKLITVTLILMFNNGLFANNEYIRIENRWTQAKLHNENGVMSLGAIQTGWWSAMWIFETVPGTEFVRIKNRRQGVYLHNQNGRVEVGNIQTGWWSAMWKVEPVAGTDFVRIKNRWKETYLHNQNRSLELGSILSGWWSAMWSLKPTEFKFVNEAKQSGSYYTSNNDPKLWIYEATSDWMCYLPDNTPLRDVSIPGTHDSGARYGGDAAEAQSWTITEQLKAGIRYLDIRCRPTGTSFAIHHGRFFQKQMFGDVMNEVVAFLKQNPSETVIMRLKSEYSAQEGSSSFQTIWNAYAKKYKSHLFQGTDSNPTIGSVRGKVFLMCNASCSGYGMSYKSDSEVQDRYKVFWFAHNQTKDSDWATLPSKKEEIRKYIDKAATSSKWVLNHLSGAVGMIPSDVARATNNTAYEYLGNKSGKTNVGIIIMDFPGEKLILRTIKTNFDFSKRCNCAPKKFRSVSDHSWVEFRLPQGNGNQTIKISSGAYNNYVFPKCNRVYWDDLEFNCNPSTCKWEKTLGDWGADALCHGSKGNSPYVFAGDR